MSKKQIVKILAYMPHLPPREVEAVVIGSLAIRKSDGKGYSVSHIPSGLSVMSHFCGPREWLKLAEAKARVVASLAAHAAHWAALDGLPFNPQLSKASPEQRAALAAIAQNPAWLKADW